MITRNDIFIIDLAALCIVLVLLYHLTEVLNRKFQRWKDKKNPRWNSEEGFQNRIHVVDERGVIYYQTHDIFSAMEFIQEEAKDKQDELFVDIVRWDGVIYTSQTQLIKDGFRKGGDQ